MASIRPDANPPKYYCMPVGWGWLALKDNTWDEPKHANYQGWIFVSKPKSVPEPASLAPLLFGLDMISVLPGATSRRCRSEA